MTPNDELKKKILPEKKDLVDWHKAEDHGFNAAISEISSNIDALDMGDWVSRKEIEDGIKRLRIRPDNQWPITKEHEKYNQALKAVERFISSLPTPAPKEDAKTGEI